MRGHDTSSSEQRPPSEGLTLDFDLVVSIALGVGLAAATGLRVDMPMLVVSAAAYTGHLPWAITSRGSERHLTALIMLGVAALQKSWPTLRRNLHVDHAPRVPRRDGGISGGDDRPAADGEVDDGHHRRRELRLTQA